MPLSIPHQLQPSPPHPSLLFLLSTASSSLPSPCPLSFSSPPSALPSPYPPFPASFLLSLSFLPAPPLPSLPPLSPLSPPSPLFPLPSFPPLRCSISITLPLTFRFVFRSLNPYMPYRRGRHDPLWCHRASHGLCARWSDAAGKIPPSPPTAHALPPSLRVHLSTAAAPQASGQKALPTPAFLEDDGVASDGCCCLSPKVTQMGRG